MIEKYSGVYTDQLGSEKIEIANDGETLRTTIRGFEFRGHSFDGLEPIDVAHAVASNLFIVNPCGNDLCGCQLTARIPIILVQHEQQLEGSLDMELRLGMPTSNGGIDDETLRLTLHYSHQVIESAGHIGFFEDHLLDIQGKLDEGVRLKCCFGCQFGDYGVAGNGLFGGLLCFKNIKDSYQNMRTKNDYLQFIRNYDRAVQETYVCPDFEPRKPGTGYRG